MKKLAYATMTRRQRDVFDAIVRYLGERGCCPSFEEIGRMVRLNSLATVHKHLNGLEQRGFIKRSYNCSRSIELTHKGRRAIHKSPMPSVPLLDPDKSLAENYDMLWERYAKTPEVVT